MTKYDLISILALMATIAINSALVYLQKTRQLYRRFGHQAYFVHSVVITLVWGGFIVTEFLANASTWRFNHTYPAIGLPIMAAALTLFVAALTQIGGNALANGNFFHYPIRKLGGIYLYIKEPIYWSYAAWFFGLAFLTGMKVFLAYVVITIVGLVLFESWVERPASPK
jgi:protein-S-isoprenylcysteine O-methyltransferase Ste14